MRATVLLLAAATPACLAPLDQVVLEAPPAHPQFPSRPEEDGLFAQASLFPDAERIFGIDLVGRGVLPVGLRVGTLPGGSTLLLDEKRCAPRLYLEDGTELEALRAEDFRTHIPAIDEKIELLALAHGPLAPWQDSELAFLFFRIEPPVRVSGIHALSKGGGVWRELELERSLVAFDVTGADGERPVRVGLRRAPWAGPVRPAAAP